MTRLTEVARYERTVAASLERVWENVHDWEHLPWLHSSAFASIELIDASSSGWTAKVESLTVDQVYELTIDLRVEESGDRYVTRTVAGTGEGSEIWTELAARSEHETDVAVSFRLPGVSGETAELLGAYYRDLYGRLWDEDERMMRHREKMLAALRVAGDSPDRIALGPEQALRGRLPETVEIGGLPYRIDSIDGRMVVFSAVCPHLLGPLGAGEASEGRLRCPWHGYEFDVAAGASCDGRALRMLPAGVIEIDDGQVFVRVRQRDPGE